MNAGLRITRRKLTSTCVQCSLFSTYTSSTGRYPPKNANNTKYSRNTGTFLFLHITTFVHAIHEGEDGVEPEHDNYSSFNNGQNKQRPKYGNIRNFKPVENDYIDPKSAVVNPKSQCILSLLSISYPFYTCILTNRVIYGTACVYAALTASRRKVYQLFVNESITQQHEEEDTSSSPEG
jgi:hypothetical protein